MSVFARAGDVVRKLRSASQPSEGRTDP